MKPEDITERVIEICKDIFDNDEVDYSMTTSSGDVPEWDSLTHLDLLNEIEEEFKFKLSLEELTTIKTIGDITTAIINHL